MNLKRKEFEMKMYQIHIKIGNTVNIRNMTQEEYNEEFDYILGIADQVMINVIRTPEIYDNEEQAVS